MTKKSALEQALFESEEIFARVTENAKDMLYNQIKPEISKNITESIEDMLGAKEDKNDEPALGDDDSTSAPESTDDVPAVTGDEPTGDDLPNDDTMPSVDEPALDGPSIDGDPAVEVPMSGPEDGDEDTLDMTGAPDDELISVWKKLKDNAEIEVVKNDDNTVSLNANGEEFLIKLNENEELALEEEFKKFEESFGQDDKYKFLDGIQKEDQAPAESETIIEIVMDEDVDGSIPAPTQNDPNTQEAPIEEVARTHSDGRNMTRKPEGFYKYAADRLRTAVSESAANDKVLINEAETLKVEKAKLITENESLKDDLTKHKDALRLMKENLESVALFNSKLAFVNKIFCEHATTNLEKKTIIERFDRDEIVDHKDVKALYKTISTEMKQTPIKESVEQKVSGTSINGTGAPLLESVSPAKTALSDRLERVKTLMNYNVNNK